MKTENQKNENITFDNVKNYANEITETVYYDNWECLPPILIHSLNGQNLRGFIVPEPYTHNNLGLPVFNMYFKIKEPLTENIKYYSLKKYVYLTFEDKPVYYYENYHYCTCKAFTN